MFRIFAVVLLVTSSLSVQAECATRKPEGFQRFFEKFAASRPFAISRTLYPLKIETSRYGIDAQGKDVSGKSLSLRSALDDAKGESMSAEMERNQLSYRVLSIRKNLAVVNVAGEGDGLLFNHHFIRKGNCWFLEKLEDYSL